ncbi:BC1881 family protein [Lysinibacillus sphaericus]|nr:BC1881 family protein [Lysinibacillus sphaericus]
MEPKTTVTLHDELVSHEGVIEIVIRPFEKFSIVQDQRVHEFTGPAK